MIFSSRQFFQKNKETNSTLLYVDLFSLVNGRKWRHQKDISKLTDLYHCSVCARKPSNSSFSPVWYTDFKNVSFEKNHWVPSEVLEVKRSFSSSLRPNFGFHLIVIGFKEKKIIILSFEVVWPWRPQRPEKPQGRRF